MYERGLVLVAVSCLLTLVHTQQEPALLTPVETDGTTIDIGQTSKSTINGTYWVTFSNKIRLGHDLDINVKILKGIEDVQVSVELFNQDGSTQLVSATGIAKPGDVETIVLKIPQDIPPPSADHHYGSYRLNVMGRSQEVTFKDTTTVTYDSRSFSIYVQTNKGKYKPLQRVKVRAMAILPGSLKPVTGEPWDIVVKDPKDIIMWQKLNMVSSKGVIEFSIPLADRVPYGDWTITATVLGNEMVKTFTVEDYVLPKFSVEAILPPFGVVTDNALPVKVKAKYTFGKPLTEGTVVVTLTSRSYYCTSWRGGVCGDPEKSIVWKGELDKNGEFNRRASKRELLDLVGSGQLNYHRFHVKAVVTNDHTRVSEEDEADIYFYPSHLSVQFLTISPRVFKPGLSWTGYMEVTKVDGTKLSPQEAMRLKIKVKAEYGVKVTDETPVESPPLKTGNSSVSGASTGEGEAPGGKLSPAEASTGDILEAEASRVAFPGEDIGWGSSTRWETRTIEMQSPIDVDADGFAVVSFEFPKNAEYANIQAYVVGHEKDVTTGTYINPAFSPSHSYLQLILPPMKKVQVGERLNVVVKTTEDISELQYQLYSKGMMVQTQTVSSPTPTSLMEFGIPLTRDMAPTLKMMVFYVREENHEFVNDAVTLNVNGLFQRPLTMSFNPTTAKPGETVKLTIEQDVADLNEETYAYVLANDLSVQLLSPGTMITEDIVRQDLMMYEYGSYYPWMRYMFMCGMPSYYGGQNAAAVFRNAGVTVLTDALLYGQYGSTDRFWGEGPTDMIGSPTDGVIPEGDQTATSTGSKLPAGESALAPERVRKDFPETWLWDMYTINAGESKVEIDLVVADTITMWPTSAFTINPTLGLTAPEYPTNVTTFQPLSVQLQLPNDVTRGEEFCFTASVFNYHTAPLPVIISLAGSTDYNSIYLRREGGLIKKGPIQGSYNYLKGNLNPDQVDSAMFCLTPTSLGEVPLKVSALTSVPGLSDAVERILKVKPAGIPRSTAFSYLLKIDTSQTVDVSPLADFVEGSQYITVNIVGNILGPILDGIDDLLRRPYGCGEQNMLNFAPNVYLLDFFFKTETMTPDRLEKGRDYMLIGYQKARMYEHGETGGYSTFGNNDNTEENPSLWLTAFIAKCFSQSYELNKYETVIKIDPLILQRSLRYILSQQRENGYFVEIGKVFNKNMQGGLDGSSAKDVALTAYTVIALQEMKKVFETTQPALVKMIDESSALADAFLSGQLGSLTDPYDICITTYALQLTDSQAKDRAYDRMMEVAMQDRDEYLYWSRRSDTAVPSSSWRQYKEDAISVEATSYALLALLERQVGDNVYLKVVRWLSTQRGSNSGFRSTQDTVVGLQALTALPASMSRNEGLPYTVEVAFGDNAQQRQTREVTITETNQLMVNRVDVPYDYATGTPSEIVLSATAAGNAGKSSVFAEVILGYNEATTVEDAFFYADHKLKMLEDGIQLHITVSTAGKDPASMTLLEVDIPPGYQPDLDLKSALISEVELKESSLVLYFNTGAIGPEPVTVSIFMSSLPGQALPTVEEKFFKFSLYYEPEKEFSKSYTLERGEFCQEAKDYSICPYGPVVIED